MELRRCRVVRTAFVFAVSDPRCLAAADEPRPAASAWAKPRPASGGFGVSVRAAGAVTGIRATLPVPMDWPEQQVKIVREEKSAERRQHDLRHARRRREADAGEHPATGSRRRSSAHRHHGNHQAPHSGTRAHGRLSSRAKTGAASSKFLGKSPYIEIDRSKNQVAGRRIDGRQEPAAGRSRQPCSTGCGPT